MSDSKRTSPITDRETRADRERRVEAAYGVDAARQCKEHLCQHLVSALLHGTPPLCEHPGCIQHYRASRALLETRAQYCLGPALL